MFRVVSEGLCMESTLKFELSKLREKDRECLYSGRRED